MITSVKYISIQFKVWSHVGIFIRYKNKLATDSCNTIDKSEHHSVKSPTKNRKWIIALT